MTRIEAPRGTHDVLPSDQPLWQKVTGEMERLCALYGYRRIQTPGFEDTDLFQRTPAPARTSCRRRCTPSRTGRPLARAPPRGHRADLPRVPRARHAPRAAAGEALHDRADVPLRRPAARPLSRALAALARDIGSADPAIDAEVIQFYDALLSRLGVRQYELQLNSIGDREMPAGVPRDS